LRKDSVDSAAKLRDLRHSDVPRFFLNTLPKFSNLVFLAKGRTNHTNEIIVDFAGRSPPVVGKSGTELDIFRWTAKIPFRIPLHGDCRRFHHVAREQFSPLASRLYGVETSDALNSASVALICLVLGGLTITGSACG
jgi:hypothetical protein